MSGADISVIASITFCQVTDLNFPQLIAYLFGAGLCTGNNIIEIPAEKEVINKTHTRSRTENSLFQFCLTVSPIYLEEMKNYYSLSVSRTVSQLIMRFRKPKVEYKLEPSV